MRFTSGPATLSEGDFEVRVGHGSAANPVGAHDDENLFTRVAPRGSDLERTAFGSLLPSMRCAGPGRRVTGQARRSAEAARCLDGDLLRTVIPYSPPTHSSPPPFLDWLAGTWPMW